MQLSASRAWCGSKAVEGVVGGMLALSLIVPALIVPAIIIPSGALAAVEPSAHPLKTRRPSVRARVAREGAFSVGDIQGISGKPTAIPVTLPAAKSADYSLLTIRGLPKTISLSAGFRFEDSWAVSLSDVDSLAMFAPADFNGRFNMEIQLIRGQDLPPEKLTVAVEIKPRSNVIETAGVTSRATYGGAATRAGEREPVVRPVMPTPVLTAPAPPKLTPKEEATMIERGNRLLQTGDITAARMVFERLGRRESAKGAFAAALTFDPEFFATLKVVGMKPDVRKAKDWYRRAAEMGHQEASKRLSSLGSP